MAADGGTVQVDVGGLMVTVATMRRLGDGAGSAGVPAPGLPGAPTGLASAAETLRAAQARLSASSAMQVHGLADRAQQAVDRVVAADRWV